VGLNFECAPNRCVPLPGGEIMLFIIRFCLFKNGFLLCLACYESRGTIMESSGAGEIEWRGGSPSPRCIAGTSQSSAAAQAGCVRCKYFLPCVLSMSAAHLWRSRAVRPQGAEGGTRHDPDDERSPARRPTSGGSVPRPAQTLNATSHCPLWTSCRRVHPSRRGSIMRVGPS